MGHKRSANEGKRRNCGKSGQLDRDIDSGSLTGGQEWRLVRKKPVRMEWKVLETPGGDSEGVFGVVRVDEWQPLVSESAARLKLLKRHAPGLGVRSATLGGRRGGRVLDEALALALDRLAVDAVAAAHLGVVADLDRARYHHEGRQADDEEAGGHDDRDQQLGARLVQVEARHHEERVVLQGKSEARSSSANIMARGLEHPYLLPFKIPLTLGLFIKLFLILSRSFRIISSLEYSLALTLKPTSTPTPTPPCILFASIYIFLLIT
jgi:hypothetical protein